jgi:hypothetical protein
MDIRKNRIMKLVLEVTYTTEPLKIAANLLRIADVLSTDGVFCCTERLTVNYKEIANNRNISLLKKALKEAYLKEGREIIEIKQLEKIGFSLREKKYEI